MDHQQIEEAGKRRERHAKLKTLEDLYNKLKTHGL